MSTNDGTGSDNQPIRVCQSVQVALSHFFEELWSKVIEDKESQNEFGSQSNNEISI